MLGGKGAGVVALGETGAGALGDETMGMLIGEGDLVDEGAVYGTVMVEMTMSDVSDVCCGIMIVGKIWERDVDLEALDGNGIKVVGKEPDGVNLGTNAVGEDFDPVNEGESVITVASGARVVGFGITTSGDTTTVGTAEGVFGSGKMMVGTGPSCVDFDKTVEAVGMADPGPAVPGLGFGPGFGSSGCGPDGAHGLNSCSKLKSVACRSFSLI